MLRRDPNGKFTYRDVGLFKKSRLFRFSTRTSQAVEIDAQRYTALVEVQHSRPALVLSSNTNRKRWWFYKKEFYVEDEGYSETELKALLDDMIAKKNRKLERALELAKRSVRERPSLLSKVSVAKVPKRPNKPGVKKGPAIEIRLLEKVQVIEALQVMAALFAASNGISSSNNPTSQNAAQLKQVYANRYNSDWTDAITEVWRWHRFVLLGKGSESSEEIYASYVSRVQQVQNKPLKITKYEKRYDGQPGELPGFPSLSSREKKWVEAGQEWIYKGFIYEVSGAYLDNQIELLIQEDYDKEFQRFEKLKLKFTRDSVTSQSYSRPRIPEHVRFEVWRRDQGKCARCGSRINLEFDHIVPISKGGSNTVKNIELLCEHHNRSKSDNIV